MQRHSMSDIVYVSPELYLLSKKWWKSGSQKPGFIPILRADVPKFQQSLRDLAKSNETPVTAGNDNDDSKVTTASLAGNSTSSKNNSSTSNGAYQSLKQFFPIGLQQQLHTLALQGLPNKLSNDGLNQFLCECIKKIVSWQGVEEAASVETWTNVRFFDLQTQDVYFRLAKMNDTLYSQICKSFDLLFPLSSEEPGKYAIEFHIDSNTRRFVEENGPEAKQEGAKKIQDGMIKTLATLENSNQNNEKTDEAFVDQSTDYQVDLNTLSDLPSEYLPQLCKDIVDFRTRVVSIEKEKRVRDSYEENKRRRHQMMRIFDQIRKSKKDTLGPEEIGSDESDDEQADEGVDDEDDLQIEKQRVQRIKEASDLKYKAALSKLKHEIEPRLIALQKEITRQQNYEQTLIEERPLHLKELLHQANDPYYDHHRSFKLSEEEKDAEDRDKFGLQLAEDVVPRSETDTQAQTENHPVIEPSPEQVKIKFAFKKAIDKSIAREEPAPESPKESPRESVIPDSLPFQDEELESHLDRLKESRVVDELVKEYLGVYETELVQYIFDNIRENKNKQILLEELKETFDDDATTIVDAIWSSSNWE